MSQRSNPAKCVRVLRVASRASLLALAQTEWVVQRLRGAWPDLDLQIVPASTPGDRDKQTPLTSLGQGVFVKGVEELLLAGRADIAVHSLKDVPTVLTPGLDLATFPEREDPRDGLICRVGCDLEDLPREATVGTGSPRRAAQLLGLRPDLRIVPVRGNLDTRIRKLHGGDFDALMLAVAGLVRLDRLAELSQVFSPDAVTPAAGQGALVVQARTHDAATRALLEPLDDPACRAEALAERAFLAALGGGCQLPAGALGRADGRVLTVVGVAASPDGREVARESAEGSSGDPASVGRAVAEALLPRARGLLEGRV